MKDLEKGNGYGRFSTGKILVQNDDGISYYIIFATLGVDIPLIVLIAELLFQKTNDRDYALMGKRWTKTFAVLLGVGIPTGTIAGVQLSLL